MTHNITIRYIHESKSDGIFNILDPLPEIPPYRDYMPRLSWRPSPPNTVVDYSELADTITKSSLSDARFFLDTSFITGHEIPPCLFDALLKRHIYVTPLVWGELQDWINNPFCNTTFRDTIVDAHQHGHPSITFIDFTSLSEQHCSTARYYIELLGLRKWLAVLLKQQFIKKHGYDPSDDLIQKQCQKMVQDRGWNLAKKGLCDHSKLNFLADEELVVLASLTGILSGAETTILTRDNDLIEQFYKILCLITTHYRCHLVADEFKKQPLNFLISEMPNIPRTQYLFDGQNNRLLRYPKGFVKDILPSNYSFVMLYCWCLGGTGKQCTLSSIHFCAEREMSCVLDVAAAQD